ncbi:hypothetical protein C2G38_2227001 [Gigaspora rosea]|uniref:Uncharacterized protein n=1 Tax=Gigaspora rosea TaxID=44941 RepID=A0A397U5Q3_9GLOM|nr:hypothetical protein C2G38_2227001 [Gigaspora rosea]
MARIKDQVISGLSISPPDAAFDCMKHKLLDLKFQITLGTLPVVLGYHLEWELLGEIVSCYTDKSKEPEKQKPIWQVPSGEVARLLMVPGKRILVVTDKKTERTRAPMAKGGPPTWPPELPEEKVMCYRSMNQGKGDLRQLKPADRSFQAN